MLGFWLKGAYYGGMFQKNGYLLAKPVDDSAIEMERQKRKHKMLTSKSGRSLSEQFMWKMDDSSLSISAEK